LDIPARKTWMGDEEIDIKNIDMPRFGVDLRAFFIDTSPNYIPFYCKIEQFDCRDYWKKVRKVQFYLFVYYF